MGQAHHRPWPQAGVRDGAVLPGADPDDPDSDPIGESNDLKDAGEGRAAHAILMKLCDADLRCLDAHAHLGNFVFDHRPKEAIRHYEAGVRIGELSLGPAFDGLLPWGHVDNRPFLRCMHGFGVCLWRLGRFDEAEGVFDRMLWLNPSDNLVPLHVLGAHEILPRSSWTNPGSRSGSNTVPTTSGAWRKACICTSPAVASTKRTRRRASGSTSTEMMRHAAVIKVALLRRARP